LYSKWSQFFPPGTALLAINSGIQGFRNLGIRLRREIVFNSLIPQLEIPQFRFIRVKGSAKNNFTELAPRFMLDFFDLIEQNHRVSPACRWRDIEDFESEDRRKMTLRWAPIL
jgi:hypothetical protein